MFSTFQVREIAAWTFAILNLLFIQFLHIQFWGVISIVSGGE